MKFLCFSGWVRQLWKVKKQRKKVTNQYVGWNWNTTDWRGRDTRRGKRLDCQCIFLRLKIWVNFSQPTCTQKQFWYTTTNSCCVHVVRYDWKTFLCILFFTATSDNQHADLPPVYVLACKAGVFWSAIHELFSGMTFSRHLGR